MAQGADAGAQRDDAAGGQRLDPVDLQRRRGPRPQILSGVSFNANKAARTDPILASPARPVYVRRMDSRNYSPLDTLLGRLDDALRTALGPAPPSARANPADARGGDELDPVARALGGRLMRVNHAGEICAQALYQGQALTAKLPDVRGKLEQAAREENDHLAWTAARIRELDTHTSRLNPLWYAGSFAIGAAAGFAGDRLSLGFLAETAHQVVEHLDRHLRRLPPQDHKSRAIMEQMRHDESRHATVAVEAGAAELPAPVKRLMRFTSKIMTRVAYWV